MGPAWCEIAGDGRVRAEAGVGRSVVSMWWLRELRYTLAGKLLIFALCGAIISGIGFFAYRSYGDVFTRSIESGETATEDTTTVESIPLTAKQSQCQQAMGELSSIVKETSKFASLGTLQSNKAFSAYARAARNCTYNEFYDFERSTLVPWMSGQDMYTAAVESGDLGAGAAETGTSPDTEGGR